MRYPIIDRLLEVGWLAAAGLVPLAVAHDSVMVGFIQMAKIGVFRSTVVFLAAVVALKWALEWRAIAPDTAEQMTALRTHPARFILLGAGAVLIATLISLLFSPVKAVSVWGIDPGWDTYALVNIVCFLVIFGVVAAHLRTSDQINRLLWTIAASAVVASLYGIGQHFGIDPFRSSAAPISRINMSFGNPIFAGAYLVLTIPISIAVVMPLRDRMAPVEHVILGIGLLAPQLTAMLFTLSRGPWVGLAVGMVALLALLYWVGGRSAAWRGGTVLATSLAIAVLFTLLPVPGGTSSTGNVVERLEDIGSGLGGGLNNRWTIWTTAADVFVSTPWPDVETFPELPGLVLRPLRPLVGYGPDMFGYAYPLAGESTYTHELATHGHNFIVHMAIELGLLGVAAYLFLAGAVAFVLYRLLHTARRAEYAPWYPLLLAGIASAFIGRAVEQIPGKAQVADFTLAWMFAGLLVALVVMRPAELSPLSEEGSVSRRRARPRRLTPSRGPAEPLSVARVAAATMLALVLLVVWFWHVWSPVSAAFITAGAERVGGDAQKTVDGYQSAIRQYPDLAIPQFRLSQTLFQISQNSSDEENKADLLQHAYDHMLAVLARNPLDHRALTRAAEYHRELGVLGKAPKDESLREALVLAQLMPGFWQGHATLAWSYVRLGDYERALQTTARAKELDNQTAATYLIYYVEAVALTNLGRREEALTAVEISLERQATDPARQLQAQLQGN